MPGASSIGGYIGAAKQAAKGTGLAPTKFFKFLSAPKLAPVQDISREPEGGSGRDDGLAVKIKHKHDISFPMYARPDTIGFILAMALGLDTVSGVGPYTHTITPTDIIPWITAEFNRQLVEQIIDCKIDSVVLEGEAGKPLKATVSVLGGATTAGGAAATATYETDVPFVFTGGVFTVDGVASTVVSKFKVEIKNNLDGDCFTTAITRNDIIEGHRQVDAEFTLKFESGDQYRKVYYGAAAGTAPATSAFSGSLIIDCTYGVAAALRELKLTIPSLQYTAAPIDDLDPAGKTLYQECVGFALAGASPVITAVVQNGTATSYTA